VAVDAGDGRLAQLRHLQEEIGEVAPLEVTVQLRDLERKTLEVRAGTEHLARAGQDDDANRLITLRAIERLAKLLDRVGTERVAVLRAIDGDRGDRVAPPIEEVFELHRLKYMARHFALRHGASRMKSWRTSSWSRRPARRSASWAAASRRWTAPELGASVIKEVLNRARVEGGEVDQVIMGTVITAGMGQIPARQAAIKAGLPHQRPGADGEQGLARHRSRPSTWPRC